jgi:hypothetical protein
MNDAGDSWKPYENGVPTRGGRKETAFSLDHLSHRHIQTVWFAVLNNFTFITVILNRTWIETGVISKGLHEV